LKFEVIFDVTASRCDVIGTILVFVNVFAISKLRSEDKMRIETQQTNFDRVLLQLVDILNTKWAVDIRHWNVWTVDEKLRKVGFIIHEYSMRNCMFTRKSAL